MSKLFPSLLDQGGPTQFKGVTRQDLSQYTPLHASSRTTAYPYMQHQSTARFAAGHSIEMVVRGRLGSGAFTIEDAAALGTFLLSVSATGGVIAGYDGWGQWLIVKAQSATVGGRVVFRQPTGGGEDWHAQATDATDWELFHQTDDNDSATKIIRVESDTGDVVLEQGILALKEQATPSAVADYGRIYTKTDNEMYYQDGAGTEKTVLTQPAVSASNYVATSETETSTSYDDLTTAGPAVTITTGTKALVILSGEVSSDTNSAYAYMGVDVSSATTIAAADAQSLHSREPAAADARVMASFVATFGLGGAGGALTAGSNVFTAKYRVSAGTGTFVFRSLTVIPL